MKISRIILFLGLLFLLFIATYGLAFYRENRAQVMVTQTNTENEFGVQVLRLGQDIETSDDGVEPEQGVIFDIDDSVSAENKNEIQELAADLGQSEGFDEELLIDAQPVVVEQQVTIQSDCSCAAAASQYYSAKAAYDLASNAVSDSLFYDGSEGYLENAKSVVAYANAKGQAYMAKQRELSQQESYVSCLLRCPLERDFAPTHMQDDILSSLSDGAYESTAAFGDNIGKKSFCSDDVAAKRDSLATALAHLSDVNMESQDSFDTLLDDFDEGDDVKNGERFADIESAVRDYEDELQNTYTVVEQNNEAYTQALRNCTGSSLTHGKYILPENPFSFLSDLWFSLRATFIEAFGSSVSKYAFYVQEYSKAKATSLLSSHPERLEVRIADIQDKVDLYENLISANRDQSVSYWKNKKIFEEVY